MSNSKLNTLKLHKQLPSNLNTINTNANTAKTKADEAKTKADQAFQAGSETKQKLVDKLTSIGIESSTAETFESLIGKILPAGKKWASGKSPLSTSNTSTFKSIYNNYTYTLPYIEFNLDFIPSLIVCACKVNDSYGAGEIVSIYTNIPLNGTNINESIKIARYAYSRNSGSSSFTNHLQADGAVKLPNNIYRIPILDSSNVSVVLENVDWYAYE